MNRMQELEQIFRENAIKAADINQNLLSMFIDNNAEEPIPEHFIDSFCINTALSDMCKAIVTLYWRK